MYVRIWLVCSLVLRYEQTLRQMRKADETSGSVAQVRFTQCIIKHSL